MATAHAQPLGADTSTSRVLPPASTERLPVLNSTRQAAACCDTRTRFSLTMISPSRTAGWGLAAARNRTVPGPWPEVGESSDSQVAAVATSQGHSGDVVTVTELMPPSAPMLDAGAASVT